MTGEDGVSRSTQVNAANRTFFVVEVVVLVVESVAKAMNAASMADRFIADASA
jgi:hypothetical protein